MLRKKALFFCALMTIVLVVFTAVTLSVNPLFTNIYTADPDCLVANNAFYIYCGRDEAATGQMSFVMDEWHILKSTDMQNWTDLGAKMALSTFSWANANAWAGSVCYKNGKYWWYVPVNDRATNAMAIGVASSTSPEGPFTDALGRALITNQTANCNIFNIDPGVFVDDDGQAYLYWGGYWALRAVKLNDDMISFSGTPVQPSGVPYSGTTRYWEAPTLRKYNGLYHLSYAANQNPATIEYCTASNPMGPWTYRGRILDTVSSTGTNHHSYNQTPFDGRYFCVYHINASDDYHRRVCVDEMYYNADGTIAKVVRTSTGPNPVGGGVTPTPTPTPGPAGSNLALSASSSTSYCSSWESITALNDGYDPTNSNDRSYTVYGNWPQTGTQWVQYDWNSAVTINKVSVYWFDDDQGIDLPASCVFKYWDGSSYVNVSNPVGLGVVGNQYNTTTFTQVTTTSLRLEVTGNGSYSTGILEWRVYGPDGSSTPNPVGDLFTWYKLDETSGTTAYDSSGNGGNATLVNGPTWVVGRTGNAVNLDGSNDYLSMPGGIISGLNDFTITAWVRPDTISSWSRIFDFGTGTSRNMFLTPRGGSGVIRFAITTNGNGAEQQINGNSALASGSWQHVAVTLSGNLGILYLNGVEVGRNTNMTLRPSSLGSTGNNYIGRSQYTVDPYLDGQVDNFRIYNRALSAAEIGNLYLEGD